MLTTDGATRRTAPVTAREYASSRESSPRAESGAIADSAGGLSCHAPGPDIPDKGVAFCNPAKTLPVSSKLILDRCQSIYSDSVWRGHSCPRNAGMRMKLCGFRGGSPVQKKAGTKNRSRHLVGWLPG